MRRHGLALQCSLFLAAMLVASSCGFRTLKRAIQRADERAGIEGRAELRLPGGGPIVVVAYSVDERAVSDLFVTPQPRPFFFALPAGTYQLAAFEDRNRDLSFQPGDEPAVLGSRLSVQAGERHHGIELVIDSREKVQLPFAVNLAGPEPGQIKQFPAPQIGTVVDIADRRFTEESAKLGLWNPLRFLLEIGAGVYFLEEYDPRKIPILFVHGALGHPGNWSYLVSQIDRRRFQPWLVYYPTAPHLDLIGQMLVRTLAALQVKYDFTHLIVVAHSMGGLVTRGAINLAVEHANDDRVVDLPLFVSISSPWAGHAAAAKGVAQAPVVAPSWRDMAPGSDFLTRLPQTALPPECTYVLLFGFRGSGGEANDGTVTVASQLWLPIQRQAAAVMGFDETHTGILRSPAVAQRLNEILAHAVE